MKELLYTVYAAGVVTGILISIGKSRLNKTNRDLIKRYYQELSAQQRTLFFDAFKYSDTLKECRAIELLTPLQRRAYNSMTRRQRKIFKDLVINYETAYFNA